MIGLGAIGRDRSLLLLLALTGLDNLFIMGPAIVGNAVLVRETLRGDAATYALVAATYGIGMIAGSLALARWGTRFRPSMGLLCGILLDGLTYVPLYWARSLPAVLVISFIHSLVIPIITVPRVTLLQRIVPTALLGRVFALVNVLVVGMTAISSGLTGLVLERVTAPQLFGVIGLLCRPQAPCRPKAPCRPQARLAARVLPMLPWSAVFIGRPMERKPLDFALLRSFSPLEGLKTENLHLLARKSVLRELPAGRFLFQEGDADNRSYFLVSGVLELVRERRTVLVIRAGSPEARNPVAPGPSQAVQRARPLRAY